MGSGIPILGAVHLSQRFRQLRPLRLDETIRISGRIIEINPHPRGSIICCEFKYGNEEDQICVEATRSGIIPLGAKEPSNSIFRPKEDLDGFNKISQKILKPSKVASFSKEAGNLIHSDVEVAKKHGFRKSLKIWSLGYFGGVPEVETSKKNVGASILTIFKIFKNRIFVNTVFRYFLIFGLHVDVWEHYHQTRNEKTRLLSYFHIIWLE